MKHLHRSGYTMVELLVVMIILGILVSASFMVFRTFRNDSIKQSGQRISSVFMNARQLSVTQRQLHFIQFDLDKSLMKLFEDTNISNSFDDKDEQIGADFRLLDGVTFSKDSALFKNTPFLVTFNANGSLYAASDIKFDPPRQADIMLLQVGKTGKLYVDFSAVTGRIGKIAYMEDE